MKGTELLRAPVFRKPESVLTERVMKLQISWSKTTCYMFSL